MKIYVWSRTSTFDCLSLFFVFFAHRYSGLLQVEFSLDDPSYPCASAREGQFGECYDTLPNQSLQVVSWPNGSFDGDRVLEFLGTPDIAPGYCVLILLAYAIAFRIAAYVALRHCGSTTGATGTTTTAASAKCVCRKPRHYHQSQSHAQSHPGSESKQKAAADDNRRVIASGATEKVIEIELPDSARESQNHKQPPPKQKQTQKKCQDKVFVCFVLLVVAGLFP